MLRLPGFGGAALFLQAAPRPARGSGTPDAGAVWGLDITFISPETRRAYVGRACDESLAASLSTFLLSAAADWHPETSVTPISDESLGLHAAVIASTPNDVTIEVKVIDDLDADAPDWDGLDFRTSRAALAQVAWEARQLFGGPGAPAAEPPQEWSMQ